MNTEWMLGVDLSVQDSLLDGLTFDDLILAVHHNCRVITPKAVMRELKEMLDTRLQDMEFLVNKNMPYIIKEAKKGRGGYESAELV